MKIIKDKASVTRIQNELDYIDLPKYNNSIKQLVEDYPDGVPDTIICKALHITPETLDKLHKNAIRKLQKSFGV